jgi:hypothetical protein
MEKLSFCDERAARLREIGASMPPTIEKQLAEVAAELERRAAKFDDQTPSPDDNGEERSLG